MTHGSQVQLYLARLHADTVLTTQKTANVHISRTMEKLISSKYKTSTEKRSCLSFSNNL